MRTIPLLLLTAGMASLLPAQETPLADVSLPIGKLAFVTSAGFGRSGEVYVMTGDHRIMSLAYKTRDPEFSPDGKAIIYAANDERATGIHLYDLDQHTNTLLLLVGQRVDAPSLSPDGKRMAFVVYYEGSSPSEGSSQIVTVDIDGTNRKELTSGEYYNWTPSWSPDGKQLLFETTRNETPATSGGGGQRDIYVMDADGQNQTNLTPNAYGHHPALSPDGKYIAYMNRGAIFTMNRDGSGKKNVSQGKVRDSEPAWSPDGEWIAFTRTPKDSHAMDIWIMKADGTQQRALTANKDGECSYSPSWSKE